MDAEQRNRLIYAFLQEMQAGGGNVSICRLPDPPRHPGLVSSVQEFFTSIDSTTSETSSIALSDRSIASTMSFHLMTSSGS